jgi:hypothetical protein
MEELGVEALATRLAAATQDRDAAAAEAERAATAVEAASRELAGAEAGDGRDESNRSMQERLADAQTAQACPGIATYTQAERERERERERGGAGGGSSAPARARARGGGGGGSSGGSGMKEEV